jgi:hypothetical protein
VFSLLSRGEANAVTGKVRDIQQRTRVNWFTKSDEMELVFRIAVFDDLGNVEKLVPVQISGSAFDGAISDNDEVRVGGRYRRGMLHATRIQNLTDGSELTASSGLPLLVKVFAVAFFSGLGAFMLYVVYRLVSGG